MPPMIATRYQVVLPWRALVLYGLENEFISFHWSESSVTASPAIELGMVTSVQFLPVAFALKSPWMYTGFSVAIVRPQLTPLGQVPTAERSAEFTSFTARRKNSGGFSRATAAFNATCIGQIPSEVE